MSKPIRILGIAGSLRRQSYNRAALRAATQLVPEGATIDIFEIDGIPGFSEDDEQNPPQKVVDACNVVARAVGFPQHLHELGRDGVDTVSGNAVPGKRVASNRPGSGIQTGAEGVVDGADATIDIAGLGEVPLPFEFGPPDIPKPAAELLAEQLLATGRGADAASAFERALARAPGRTISVEGLQVARKTGERSDRDVKTPEAHVH